MNWKSPEDAMPWVGLYVCVASLVCISAMAVDAFQGFRLWKLWFPCRFFTINAASITLIAIALKLPADLTTTPGNDILAPNFVDYDISGAKFVSMMFLFTMLANFLPSLGLMGDKELLMNIIALGILIITITVNVWIQFSTKAPFATLDQILILIFPLPLLLSVALTVPASRSILENRYKELHILTSDGHDIKFSSKELIRYVKKHWMMAETGNPQFAIACSPVSSAFGVICLNLVFYAFIFLHRELSNRSYFGSGKSDYKWSTSLVITIQSFGVMIGSVAPIFRCLTTISYFNISKKWGKNHINVFRVEKHWIQTLEQWKHNHVRSYIPGRHCKKVFHNVKTVFLNILIALQITVVVICKTICLVPRSFLILFSCCRYLYKLLLKWLKEEPNASNNTARMEMEEYTTYVLQIEEDTKLSKRILRNTLKSINQVVRVSQEKGTSNIMKLLRRSSGFNGVVEYDNDQVPPLHSDENRNSWSLVAVTLTTIAVSLPNIANSHVNELLASMREGLQLVRHVEESLNVDSDLVNARKTSRRVWTEVEVYGRWLQIDLRNARKGKTSKELIQWLGDEAIKIVIEFKRCKSHSLDHSLHKFIAASSMYRISQTILLHCNEQENWPLDEELFEWISTLISDILCACFSNIPQVIIMKCNDKVIERREENIRSAAQLLGKSKRILKILKHRQHPKLDVDSMAYIDKWHALPKSEIPNGYVSSERIQPASSTSNESLIVTIM